MSKIKYVVFPPSKLRARLMTHANFVVEPDYHVIKGPDLAKVRGLSPSYWKLEGAETIVPMSVEEQALVNSGELAGPEILLSAGIEGPTEIKAAVKTSEDMDFVSKKIEVLKLVSQVQAKQTKLEKKVRWVQISVGALAVLDAITLLLRFI